MLGRTLDDSYAASIRAGVTTVTSARLVLTGVYRFTGPFLATIARGLDVSLGELGVAVAVTELAGLTSPIIGRLVDAVARRTTMAVGAAAVALGAIVAGLSSGVVMFAVGLFVIGVGAITFNVGIGSWIADDVPYERRGRVVGLTETSWAFGLLIGVSTLGVIAAVASWRWSFVVGAAAAAVVALIVRTRLPRPTRPLGTGSSPATAAPIGPGRIDRRGWLAVASMFGMMAASQSLFVTFGPWLEDEFGFSTAALAAVTFAIGFCELGASTTSARWTDRWGKERSVIGGALVMAPAAMGLAAAQSIAPLGIALLAVFIATFEFSIVSILPVGGNLVPGRPARGIATLLAIGTLGRAVTVIPATRLYERHGLVWPCALAAAGSLVAAVAMTARLRTAR